MCECIIGVGPEVSTETMPTARKQHVCEECGATIEPGEKYQLIKGLWEGTWETHKTCTFCASVRNRAGNEQPYADEGICFGNLWECVGMDYAATA